MNAFSSQCGDATVGYVSVPETNLFGTTTWLLPLQTIASPAAGSD